MESEELKLFSKKEEFGGATYHGLLILVENGAIALLQRGEKPKLGTMAFATPPSLVGAGIAASAVLVGERHATLARVLSERLATALNRLAIVSINAREDDPPQPFIAICAGLLEDVKGVRG